MNGQTAVEQEEVNHYQELCRGMRPGLLLTLNNEDSQSVPYDEMEVKFVDDETGNVVLDGWNDGGFLIFHEDGETRIREESDDWSWNRSHEVTTIEVIGVE